MFSFVIRRRVHTVPRLPKVNQLTQNGIPNILSKSGFQTCWLDQQQYLCDKLTLATVGTSLESYLPFHLLLNTAKKPFQTNIFNLASACHNNHIFMENILPSEVKTKPSSFFLQRIQDQYSCDWDEFKEEMIRRAQSDVLGQGWLFLVENSNKEFHILTIQNNGTPYYFPRNQSFDLNSVLTMEEMTQFKTMEKVVKEGSKINDWTMPLICVNLWDYAYLNDYGISKRSEYVKNVLDNLNWTVVNNRLYTGQNGI